MLQAHFIQNAFSLLQINLPDDEQGEINKQYVQHLADYFGTLLTQSAKDAHPLEEELELTEKYLRLQQKMVKPGFTFDISLDADIDTAHLQVPVLLLQPFVENCIKHGFKALQQGSGCIKIRCFMEQGVAVIEIEDNGIGFQASANELGTGIGMALSKAQFAQAFPQSRLSWFNNAARPGCTVRLEMAQNIFINTFKSSNLSEACHLKL